ncbi:MAG TPA: hypothetical protein DCW46_08425 [Desulfotomaculum sp.]|nr:hypothetical protein [Desulfotomaculum sp.]
MAIHPVYRFYSELEDYTPKIWRRFEVNGSKTMAELGYILMTMFEMQASHLFCFTYDYGAEILKDMRKRYSDEDLEKVLGKSDFADLMKSWRFELPFEDIYENENEKWHDASKYRLKDIADRVPWQFTFKYDYGDGWRVSLTLESCEKIEIYAGELPRVLEGEGFGIIEDCGGVGGLEDLAKAFKKKKGRQYDEYREWLGTDDLDLSVFDIDDINFRLKKLPRIYKECYEYGYEPTQRSIDLIERKYKK